MNSSGMQIVGIPARSRKGSAQALDRFRQPLVSYLTSSLEDKDTWVRALAAEMPWHAAGSTSRKLPDTSSADADEDVRQHLRVRSMPSATPAWLL